MMYDMGSSTCFHLEKGGGEGGGEEGGLEDKFP